MDVGIVALVDGSRASEYFPNEAGVVDLVLLWHGGDHMALRFEIRLDAAGRHHSRVPEDAIALVRELARLMQDARLLNRCGKRTGQGNGWTEQRVRGFRGHHEIAAYRDGE